MLEDIGGVTLCVVEKEGIRSEVIGLAMADQHVNTDRIVPLKRIPVTALRQVEVESSHVI